jgi:hypothetical protein
MSDFLRLPDIALLLGKDARTVRRWCEKGFVPGAARTDGGHWRVARPDDVEAFRGEVSVRVRGFARRRFKSLSAADAEAVHAATAGARQGQADFAAAWDRAMTPALRSRLAGLARQLGAEDIPVLMSANGAAEIFFREEMFDLPATESGVREFARVFRADLIAKATVTVAEWSGRIGLATVARACGIPRTSFRRIVKKDRRRIEGAARDVAEKYYGHQSIAEPPRAGLHNRTQIQWEASECIDFADMDARNGWFEPDAATA